MIIIKLIYSNINKYFSAKIISYKNIFDAFKENILSYLYQSEEIYKYFSKDNKEKYKISKSNQNANNLNPS